MPVVRFERLARSLVIVLALLQPAMTRATVVATVRGIVHDPDHRPVPGAQVVVKAANSDYSQKLATDAEGRFEAAAVPVGAYIVTVTKDGFSASAQEIVVASGSSPVLHFQLAVGARREEVTRLGSRDGRQSRADDAHHHREPKRNRDDAGRRPEQQPGHDYRLRSGRVDHARSTSRARRPPGDLGHRRRSDSEHQHREQRRPADRSEGHRLPRSAARWLFLRVWRPHLRRVQRRSANRLRAQQRGGTVDDLRHVPSDQRSAELRKPHAKSSPTLRASTATAATTAWRRRVRMFCTTASGVSAAWAR